MKYIAAYALCALATPEPTKADIVATLTAAGVTIDSAKVDLVIAQMKGKKFEDLVAEGQKKLVSGGGGAPAATPAAAASKAEAPKAAAKVVAPPSDDEDDDMGSLF